MTAAKVGMRNGNQIQSSL